MESGKVFSLRTQSFLTFGCISGSDNLYVGLSFLLLASFQVEVEYNDSGAAASDSCSTERLVTVHAKIQSPVYSDRIKTIGVPSLIHIWVQLLISP